MWQDRHNIDDRLREFSERVRLPEVITSPIFTGRIQDALMLIEGALGKSDPLMNRLREVPIIPSFSATWNQSIIHCNFDERGPACITIRPDAVRYPVFLATGLVHEGQHAIDPAVANLNSFVRQLNSAFADRGLKTPPDALYKVRELEAGCEVSACRKEVEALGLIKPDYGGLLPEQIAYFNAQSTAMIAERQATVYFESARFASYKLAGLCFEASEKLRDRQPKALDEITGSIATLLQHTPKQNISAVGHVVTLHATSNLLKAIQDAPLPKEITGQWIAAIADVRTNLLQGQDFLSKNGPTIANVVNPPRKIH